MTITDGQLYQFRANGSTQDCDQRVSGSSYNVANASGLLCRAATALDTRQGAFGVRFNGTIDAGVASVPQASLTFRANPSTVASVPLHIYAEKNLTPAVFPSAAGSTDLTHRTKTTASVATSTPAVAGKQDIIIDLGRDIFKELMVLAGATFPTTGDVYTATVATTSPIVNPVFIVQGDVLTVGASPATKDFWVYSYDNYIADAASTNATTKANAPLTLAHNTMLSVLALPLGTVLGGTDTRTHFALCQDSYCWATQPSGARAPYDSVQYSGFLFGSLISQGIFVAKDGELDTPGGVPVGYANSGLGTTTDGYQIIDADGSTFGQGRMVPEGRSGYTTRGVLKDRLVDHFGVTAARAIIHDYGYGGTTIGDAETTTGNWAEASPGVSLDTITTYSTFGTTFPNTVVSNPLYNYRDRADGHSMLSLLVDPTIKYTTVVLPTGGNNWFAKGARTGLLPQSRTTGEWDEVSAAVTAGILTMIRFCKRAWSSASGRVSGASIDFIVPGLPNLQVDDPRIPTISVNVGAPAFAHFHRGSFPSATNPDDWYSGPNGTAATTHVDAWATAGGPAMAPYGNTTTTPAGSGGATAGAGGTPQVNVIPHIPHPFQYRFPNNTILGQTTSSPQTNVAGFTIATVPSGGRPCTKDDLGISLQLKAFSWCPATWNADFNTSYRDWYAHWAADHFGGSFSNIGSGTAGQNQWDNAHAAFIATYGSFPYSGASIQDGAPALPWNNLKIAVAYCSRNVTNDTLNSCLHLLQPAAESACSTLAGESISAQFVPLWDILGSAVGSGDTASGDRDMFLDSVHLTLAAAKLWCDGLISRARVGGSAGILNLIPASGTLSALTLEKTDASGTVLETEPSDLAGGDHWRIWGTITANGPLASTTLTMNVLTASLDGAAHAKVVNNVTEASVIASTAIDQASVLTIGSMTDGSVYRWEATGVCVG